MIVAAIAPGTLDGASAASLSTDSPARIVRPNDNRHPAGTLADGVLTLRLRASRGTWYPEGPDGPGLSIDALGEDTTPLSVPSPLIRVPEGTRIVVSVENDLDSTLALHGLCSKNGAACAPVAVSPGRSVDLQFDAGRAGTYHYWATSIGAPVPFREMAGAFVVDPPGPRTEDRILVITEWSSLTRDELIRIFNADDPDHVFVSLQPRIGFMLNGLSWPNTERLRYDLGQAVHWRVINLTSQSHPMHLHGFYFEVESLGDGVTDTPVKAEARHSVVTQLLAPGTTMAMTWTPEREGNWLFHCHIMQHVSPERRLASTGDHTADHQHVHEDGAGGMAGMIIGVTIVRGDVQPAAAAEPPAARAEDQARDGARPVRAGACLWLHRVGGSHAEASDGPARLSPPGPTLVLQRDEPVEITVVNHLGEATALHWHGMELESYYDGVHGWSGHNATLAPMIEADASFIVRFTPPRAGTFMYHTHLHDQRQLPFGLYGPMVVVDPGERFDAETDHVLMVARRGLDRAAPNVILSSTPVVLNGDTAPRFVWKAAQPHRVRLINITPGDIFSVSIQTARTRDVDAVDEGRSAAACQLACAGARSSDDRRRRNLRLRARRVAGRPPALDRGPKYGWTMGGAGAGRRQVS